MEKEKYETEIADLKAIIENLKLKDNIPSSPSSFDPTFSILLNSIPCFSGKGTPSIGYFIFRLENLFSIGSYTNSFCLQIAVCKLDGVVLSWWQKNLLLSEEEKIKTWLDFKRKLRLQFTPPEEARSNLFKLGAITQTSLLIDYITDFWSCLTTISIPNDVSQYFFLHGLSPKVQEFLYANESQLLDLDSMERACQCYDSIYQSPDPPSRKIFTANSDNSMQLKLNQTAKDKVCNYCKKKGHIIKDCFKCLRSNKNKLEKSTSKTGNQFQVNLVSERNMDIEKSNTQEDSSKDYQGYVSAFIVFDKTYKKPKSFDSSMTFYIDSGAAYHIVPDIHLLSSIQKCSISLQGPFLEANVATSIGTLSLLSLDHNSKIHPITLHKVLYVPNLSSPLLSLGQLLEENFSLEFLNNSLDFYLKKDSFF